MLNDNWNVAKIRVKESSVSQSFDDNVNYFCEIEEDKDEIMVFVVSEVALGEYREFKNYDGQTG